MNFLLPAIVLIISLLIFRCRLNGMQTRNIFAREKLVAVHIAVFLSFAITYTTSFALYSYWYSSPDGSIQKCRFFVAGWYFFLLCYISHIATLILFIYMSVQLSRPLNEYWTEFLLNYRNQTLSQVI